MTTPEPTPEQIAATVQIVDRVLDRMVQHGTEISTAYNSERIKKLGDRLDKREKWEAKVKEWKDTEALPSFELLRNQIAELRREVDKLRGAGPEEPE